MRTSGSLKSLIHGITTDKAKLADPRHLKEQINMQTVQGSGLHKRPPVDITAASTHAWGSGLYAETAKDFKWDGVDYTLHLVWEVAEPTAMFSYFVTDVDGNTVANSVASTYLEGIRGPDDWDILNREGRNWILNKTKPVSMAPELKATETTSMIYVLAPPADLSSFTVAWQDVNDASWSALITVGSAISARGTNVVAALVAAAINAEAGDVGVTAYSAGSTVSIVRTDSQYANVSVQDEEAGNVFAAINGHISDINHLPRWVAGKQVLKVQPEKESDRGIFYMESETDVTATAPTLPASDAEFVSGTVYYNPDLTRNYCGVIHQAFDCTVSGTPVAGSWTTKLVMGGITCNTFRFQNNKNGTGINSIEFFPPSTTSCGGTGWTSGTVGNITVRKKSDLSLVYETPVDASDEKPWGAGVYYDIVIPPVVDLVSGESYYIYINKPTAAVTQLEQANWVESTAPGEQFELNAKTLPHELWLNEDTAPVQFEVTEHTWEPRRAGDNKTNPLPAFIGNTITDLAVYQNRLISLTGNELVTTEVARDDTLNWFRDTVTQNLSTHPVRLRSTAQGTGNFKSVINHNKDLLLFTDKAAFKLPGDIPLTPQTAGLPVTLLQDSDQRVKPISIGDNVFFAFSYGKYTGVSKLTPDPADADKDIAIPITDHAKKYITGTPMKFVGDSNTGELYLVMTDGKIYVCDYDVSKSRNEDQRYAWSLWHDFGQIAGLRGKAFTIQTVTFTNRKIVMLIESDNDLYFCEMDTVEDPDSASRRIHLDYNIVDTVAAGAITLPATYPYNTHLVVTVSDTAHAEYGNTIPFTRSGGTGISPVQKGGTLTIDTAYNGVEVTYGYPFRASVKPNTIYVTDEGGFINSFTNLRIQNWLIHVNRSAMLYGKIISNYYSYPDQLWSGMIVGDVYSTTDSVADNTAVANFSYKQKNDLADFELFSVSHLPLSITQIEWLGNYTSRGRRF